MNFNSTEITVPSNLWSASDDRVRVLKVILRGTNANKVPYEVFVNALKDNGIFVNDDITDIHVNISETPRKRTVYGKLRFKHRQTFNIVYLDSDVSFLLIDPLDSRLEVTLLHMPYQTTPAAIRHIFKELNKDWQISDIKHSPGDQMRNDRWQCLIECGNKDLIPHSFILPKMGVEGEDLKIKIRLRGRNPPCYICDETSHTPDQCPDKRPPPAAAEPRAASATPPPPAAASQHTHVADTPTPDKKLNSQQNKTIKLSEVLLKSPERIKKGILQCSDDGYNPTHVQIVLNELSVTTTMKQLTIDQCLIPAKDEKCVPHFTLNSPMCIKQSEKKTRE